MIALQHSISAADVSRNAVSNYLNRPAERAAIADSLSIENCLEFMELLGDVAEASAHDISDLTELCLSVARLVDKEPFVSRVKGRDGFFMPNPEDSALNTISSIAKAIDVRASASIAAAIVQAQDALTVAAELVGRSYVAAPNRANLLILDASAKEALLNTFATNVLMFARSNLLLNLSSPGFLLLTLARTVPGVCSQVFEALKARDPSLDQFATHVLRYSVDSTNGQTYRLPEKVALIEAFCPLEEFRKHAALRLADSQVTYPARAAWRAVLDLYRLICAGRNAK
jgi:hypothetical protein